jgi:polar amino acid transport system substrate-binding protein
VDWVSLQHQFGTVDCDIVLDSIADRVMQGDRRIRLSRPYHVSGVALAVPLETDQVESFDDIAPGQRVAVLAGSVASEVLAKRGARIISFAFEDEMVEAVANGEVDAAAVSPASAGYYNHRHPDKRVRLVHAYDHEPALRWTVAVGMRRADRPAIAAINEALERLIENGTINTIYDRYGIEHRLP